MSLPSVLWQPKAANEFTFFDICCQCNFIIQTWISTGAKHPICFRYGGQSRVQKWLTCFRILVVFFLVCGSLWKRFGHPYFQKLALYSRIYGEGKKKEIVYTWCPCDMLHPLTLGLLGTLWQTCCGELCDKASSATSSARRWETTSATMTSASPESHGIAPSAPSTPSSSPLSSRPAAAVPSWSCLCTRSAI